MLKSRGIILIPERKNKAFLESMESFFGFKIGVYSGVFDNETSQENLQYAEQIINSCLLKINKAKK